MDLSFLINPSRPHERGFALISVLSVVVLLALLLVSLGLLLQSEVRSSAVAADLSEARSMALFGMNKALGELQGLAGPDQRVTATADILPSVDPAKRHWTGVWRTTDYDPAAPDTKEFLAWLVSGPQRLTAPTDATGAPTGDQILLVGEGDVGNDTDLQVSAPLVPVTDGAGATIGEYAYWVGDEGVKARFDLPRPADADPTRARYDFMTGQRDAVEFFGASPGSVFTQASALNPITPDFLAREQLELVGVSEANRRAHFHDISLFSSGVLSDTKNGGLRKDLTWLFEADDSAAAPVLASLDANSAPGSQISADWPSDPSRLHWPASPTWELLRDFYRLKDEPLPIQPRKQTATAQGLFPVVTRCYLNLLPGVRHDDPDPVSYLRLNFDPQVVLWNPYNVPIAGREYDLEIALTRVSMFLEIQQTDHGRTLDMVGVPGTGFALYSDNTFPSPSAAPPYHSVTFRIPAVEFGPGETRIFTVADSEDGQPYSGANLLANQAPVGGVPNTVWLEHPDPVNRVPPIPNFKLRLQASSTSTSAISAQLVHVALRAGGEYWSRLGRRSAIGSSPYDDPGAAQLSDALVSSNLNQLQQARAYMFSGEGYRNPRWIANYNPRATVIDQSPADLVNNPIYTFGWVRGNNRSRFTDTDMSGGAIRERPNGRTVFQLAPFEVPTAGEMRLSIADFQHANVNPTGTSNAYLIGNSLLDHRLGSADTEATRTTRAGNANHAPVVDGSYLLNDALWDRYFLSTIAEDYTAANLTTGEPLPNARMRPRSNAIITDLQNFETAAANLLLEGAFNVNSTSVDAWKALLAGRNGLAFDPVSGGTGGALGAAFSRLARPVAGLNAPWLGFRQLTPAQLQTLAERIVDEVRSRGPFMSLADFVNRRLASASDERAVKGALARAIEEALINTNADQQLPGQVNDGTNWNPTGQPQSWYIEQAMLGSNNAAATNWITQGDVLQGIGGAIAARSDTFVIRSYGRTVDSTGAITSEARCEALVQRVPEPVDPDPARPTEPLDPDVLGREFRVVAFRWLDPSEI